MGSTTKNRLTTDCLREGVYGNVASAVPRSKRLEGVPRQGEEGRGTTRRLDVSRHRQGTRLPVAVPAC
jgi:hypothetical protein